jgi:hypothetical protein
MRKSAKPRTPKKAPRPKTALKKAAPNKTAPVKTASTKKVAAKHIAPTPKPPVAGALQGSDPPAKRFTLSSTSARAIEKELERLFEMLPDLRRWRRGGPN